MEPFQKAKNSERQVTPVENDYTIDPTARNLIHREPSEDDYLVPREFFPLKTKPDYHDDTGVEFRPLKGNIKDFSSKVPLHLYAEKMKEEKPPLPQPMPRVYRRPRPATPGSGPQIPESKSSMPLPQVYHLPPQGQGVTGWGSGPLPSHLQGYPSVSCPSQRTVTPILPTVS